MTTSALLRPMAALAIVTVTGLALRALSLWPLGDPVANAAVRLSWSARPERLEACRTLTDAELAERPAHMRMRVECSGTHARYALILMVDSVPVLQDTVRGGGIRHDRPMYLLREVPIMAGTHRLHVSLTRVDSLTAPLAADSGATEGLGDRASRESDERRRRAAEALPPQLVLDTLLALEPGRVLVITYRDEARRLEVVTPRP